MPKTRPVRKAAKGVAAATQAVTGGRQGRPPHSPGDEAADQAQGTSAASDVDQLKACISRLEQNQAEMQQSLQNMQQMLLQTTSQQVASNLPPEPNRGADMQPSTSNMAWQNMQQPVSTNPPDMNPTAIHHATNPAAHLCHDITGNNRVGVPVDLFIDDRTKNRIWANEAIDLAILIKKGKPKQFSIEVGRSESGPAFLLSDVDDPAMVEMKWREWDEAWNIFQAIYLSKYTSQYYRDGLAQHKSHVSRLMSEGGKWADYDMKFRRMVQRSLTPWGAMHAELYTSAWIAGQREKSEKHKAQNTKKNPNTFGKRGGLVPTGSCIKFHAKGTCGFPNCRYSHECYKCKKGSHSASACTVPVKPGTDQEVGQKSSFRRSEAGKQITSKSN